MRLYTGENCHADVVVEGADLGLGHPELIEQAKAEAKALVAETGMVVYPDSFLGHFSIRGAAFNQGEHPTLTSEEVARLEQLGEVIAA